MGVPFRHEAEKSAIACLILEFHDSLRDGQGLSVVEMGDSFYGFFTA